MSAGPRADERVRSRSSGLGYLENVVFDAINPQALGRFWETALGTET